MAASDDKKNATVDLNTVILLLNDRFENNEKLLRLQFNMLHGKMDDLAKENNKRDDELKKALDSAVTERNDKIESLRQETAGTLDALKGDITIINARVDVLENADNKKAAGFLETIKTKSLEYLSTAAIVGLLYYIFHVITTGKFLE